MQRLAKWFTTLSPKDKAKIVKDVTQLVLAPVSYTHLTLPTIYSV